jgi:hypothetical protein
MTAESMTSKMCSIMVQLSFAEVKKDRQKRRVLVHLMFATLRNWLAAGVHIPAVAQSLGRSLWVVEMVGSC